MADEFVNYYEVLQIPQTADAAAVKAAVSRERRVWLKRQNSADPARRVEAEKRVRHIDEAERTLSSTTMRPDHDRKLANHKDAPPAPLDTDRSDWMQRARAYLDMGNPGAAHRAAREATNLRGSDHEAWALRAHASVLTAQVADAEFEFAEAIRLEPENASYHHDLGEVFSEQEKWPQAMREYDVALRLAPNDPVTRTSIALVHLQTGSSDKALSIMEAVHREDPGNEVFRYYLAAALDGAARDSLTMLNDESLIATSLAQVERLEAYAGRIAALKLRDPEVVEAEREMRRMAGAAREIMWMNDGAWRNYAIGLGVLGCVACGGLGSNSGGTIALTILVVFPLIAAVVYFYIRGHRRPTWQHAANQLRNLTVRRGI